MRTLVRIALASFISIAPGIARAESAAEATPAQKEAAARFERGVELYADGGLEAALVEFERAYELVSDYRVLYNVGRVQAERHRYVEAIQAFEKYLRDGGEEVPSARRTQVEGDLEKLRGRVANLWVESDTPGSELFINGVGIGNLPFKGPIAVNPGSLELRLEKVGYRTARQVLKVASGESPRVSMALEPMPAAMPEASQATSRPDDSRPTRNYTPFWISATTTAVLGGGAAAFGILSLDRQNQLESALDQFPADSDEVESLRSEGKTFAALADGLTIGAVVAAGVSVYFLLDPPRKREDPRVISDLRFSTSGNQVSLSGRF